MLALLLGAALAGFRPAAGTQVKIFQTQNLAGFAAGNLDGVSIDTLGRMSLAPKADKVATLGEPFVLSAAVLPAAGGGDGGGWVVGTGNAGKVLRIDRNGAATELFTATEPEVFAVWADPDGTVFAGTSPRGKVYRIAKGKSEVYFDPGATYIWALARAADGSLLVATGTEGKLFRVTGAGQGKLLYDADDTHLRSLELLPGGDVMIGTAGEGLILRLGKDGTARTVYDAAEPEVVALASAPDGTTYAAVVSSESSLVDLSKDAAAAAAGGGKPGEPKATVTVEAGDQPTGTRRPGDTGPRSEILKISPAGVVEVLWAFAEETAYDLLWRDGSLWIGTGVDGKLFRWSDNQMMLEKDVDDRQIVALLPALAPGDAGPAFATTNASALYRVTAGTERKGTYTSGVLDAGQAARFGTFRWEGETPGGSSLRFSFRSGLSAQPDRTWSAWTEARPGSEIPLDGVPRGRYVQWRAEMAGDGKASPRLWESELSYRQENLSPRIQGLAALEPGQILVPANFNPSNQVYEPAHPNKEGIFTTPGAPADEDDSGRTKPLWKKGYRTLRWNAADPNGDDLAYTLSFRPAGSDGAWLTMASGLEDNYYSFDATALPDGVFRFKLTASDAPSNDEGGALAADRISDPVVIDNAPPALIKVDRDGARLRATVSDAASPLRTAEFSVDAKEWKPVRALDGLLDGKTETLLIDPAEAGTGTDAGTDAGKGKPGGSLVLLRVTDAAYNVTTFNLSEAR